MAAGRASIAADWFGKLGYELPRGVNQADFFLDIASGEISTYKINGEDARLHCIACAEKFMEDNPDGFTEGAVLKESDLGAHLWNAAEVRPAQGAWCGTKKMHSKKFFSDFWSCVPCHCATSHNVQQTKTAHRALSS